MKELKMNEIEEKANRIVNARENKFYNLLHPLLIIILFFLFFILTIVFFVAGFHTNLIRYYMLSLLFFLSFMLTINIYKIIFFVKYRKDKEYQMAKKVLEKYDKKLKEQLKRKEVEAIIVKEKEKSKTMLGMEEYLKEDN